VTSLRGSVEVVNVGEVATEQAGDQADDPNESWWSIIRQISAVAIPCGISNIIGDDLPGIIALVVIGITGDDKETSAMGLGETFVNVTGMSLVHGLASAILTFSSQAAGAENWQRVGIVGQRALAIICVGMLPMIAIWAAAQPILSALGQDQEVADLVGNYALCRIPGFLFVAVQTPVTYTMWATANGRKVMYVKVATALVGIGLTVLMIYTIGFLGAPIAASIQNALNTILLLVVAWKDENMRQCWHGWSREALSEWCPYLAIAGPGTIMVCAEWWTWEILVFLCGLISVSALGAVTTTNATIFLVFSVCRAWGMGGVVTVGGALGSGDGQRAKRIAMVLVASGLVILVVQLIVLAPLGKEVGELYTNDDDIISDMTSVWGLVIVVEFLESSQVFFGKIMTACGMQQKATIPLVVSNWVVGVPLAVVLAFPAKVGYKGIWWGIFAGGVLHLLLYVVLVMRIDWSKEASAASSTAMQEDKLEDVGFEYAEFMDDSSNSKL